MTFWRTTGLPREMTLICERIGATAVPRIPAVVGAAKAGPKLVRAVARVRRKPDGHLQTALD